MKGVKKISLIGVELVGLNVRKISERSHAEEAQLTRQTSIIVLEHKDEIAKVRLSTKVFFKPSGPFEIDLDLEGRYSIAGTVDAESLKRQLEESTYPLFAEASLIIGFISGKILGVPVIVAPFKESEGNHTPPVD